MDKKLSDYKKYIKAEVESLEREFKNSKSHDETKQIINKIEKLSKYHNQAVKNFQHERFIHLIVTFFFATLLILSIFVLFFVSSVSADYSNFALITWMTVAVVIILFITEIFYVRHYYQLENGTQGLYEFTKKLYELSSQNKSL